jgi:hypothetical protein
MSNNLDDLFPNGIGLVGEIPAKESLSLEDIDRHFMRMSEPKNVFMIKKERLEFLVGCLVSLLAIIGAISLVIKVVSSL